MPFNTVHEANRLRWDGKRKPFYEIYYLKLVDPKRLWSFWARYTILIPTSDDQEPSASVWGIFCHENQKTVAIKKTVSLSDIDVYHNEHFINIEEDYLALDTTKGNLSREVSHLQWDLVFEDPTTILSLYPHRFLYTLPIPKTKFLESRFSTFVSGTIQVDRNTHRVEHCLAHQAHIWGTQYAKRWAWGNCNEFEEDPTALFEGLVAEIQLGPITSPPLALFYFVVEGKEYRGNGICKWIANESEHDLFQWKFEVVCGKTKFVGRLMRDSEQIVGVKYVGPNGENRFCHNTMMANMALDILKKEKGHWVPQKRLTCKRAAAFETVESAPDERVPYVL